MNKSKDSTFLYISKNGDGSVTLEEDNLPKVARKKIRDKIKNIFENDYPKAFKDFNITTISPYFQKSEWPTILTGSLLSSDGSTGKEIVRYRWHRVDLWLNALNNLSKEGNRFDIETSLLKLFEDPSDKNRYWAIIRQNWKTIKGNSVTYEDNGFLFVNFDFDNNLNIKSFVIHYRLWFYDYKYDRIVDGVIIETRGEKLKRDLDNIFLKSIRGIDENLKKGMVKYIIDRVDNRFY
jgi:hypothetical protein